MMRFMIFIGLKAINRKRQILVAIFLSIICGAKSIQAQTVKVNNTLSSNWSNNGSGKIFKYNPSIGLEYLESKHFCLSSNIGLSNYAQKYSIYDNDNILKANIRYIELNTTARYKIPIKDFLSSLEVE